MELAVFAVVSLVLLQIQCATIAEKNLMFDSCLQEVGIKEGKPLTAKIFEDAYPCLLACISKAEGTMNNDKIVVDKYIENYANLYSPAASDKEKNKLSECAADQANKQNDKCAVREAMRKCEFENHNILYPPTRD